MEAFCRVLDDFAGFAAAQQICRLAVKWEMRGKKLGVPAKVVVGRLRDGPFVAPRNEADFSTELEIRGYSRLCGAEPSFSSVIFGEKRIQAAGEAANRDGLK
jgi:hypothetical protein